MERFFIKQIAWKDGRASLLAVRHEVFVVEQGVPEELEEDGLDAKCTQVLAVDGLGAAIGTARLMPEGRVSRVAVVKKWRGCGVGAALVEHLEQVARAMGMESLILHSQVDTVGFYENRGFVVVPGEEFVEAGIAHRLMEKKWQAAECDDK